MAPPDPNSLPDYDPYELFKDELDLDFDEPEPEQPPIDVAQVPTYTPQDEDRLYTDEVIQENEMASRVLFVSVIAAGLISGGIGLWYLAVRQSPPVPQNTPLPVPSQPPIAPPSGVNPVQPIAPTALPNPSLPPTDSGVVPDPNSPIPTGLPSPGAVNPSGLGTPMPPAPPTLPPP